MCHHTKRTCTEPINGEDEEADPSLVAIAAAAFSRAQAARTAAVAQE